MPSVPRASWSIPGEPPGKHKNQAVNCEEVRRGFERSGWLLPYFYESACPPPPKRKKCRSIRQPEAVHTRFSDRISIVLLACPPMDLAQLPAWQMATGIRNGNFSATELLEAHLRNIERWNPKLNAFVSVDQLRSRIQAKEADEAVKNGRPLGPLHGVPITIKSSIDVAGLLCETGTQIRKGYIAASDAPLVSRL